MKKNKKKPITNEKRDNNLLKARALERESNITLVSTSLSIISFILMLYIQNMVTTNFLTAKSFLNIIIFILAVGFVATILVAIWKKKFFLFEYSAFCLVFMIGYYLLPRGASAFSFLFPSQEGAFIVTPLRAKLSQILTTTNITYALWTLNVLYCILTISLHTLKYSRIKSGKNWLWELLYKELQRQALQ